MTRRPLTEKLVLSLKSNGKPQVDHFDAGCAGLSLRVTAAGKKTWAFNYTSPRDAKRARYTIGTFPATTLKSARDLAIAARGNVERGKDPRDIEVVVAPKTMAELIEDRLSMELRGKLRSAAKIERRFEKYVIPKVGNVPVRDFQIEPHYNSVLDPLLKRNKARAAGILFQDLRALMNFAIRRGVIEYSRIAKLKRPDKLNNRTRILSEKEIAVVWNGLEAALPRSDHIPDVLRLCLATGQRLGEVAGMKRGEINLPERLWTIPATRTKNKFEHVVPLTDLALTIIRDVMKETNGDYLFPNRAKDGPTTHNVIDYALGKAQKPRGGKPMGKFGIPHWTPHDLRRTVATQMSRLKIEQIVIGHVLNHRTTTKVSITQQVYDHNDFAAEKREALQKWAERLATVIEREDPSVFAISDARHAKW